MHNQRSKTIDNSLRTKDIHVDEYSGNPNELCEVTTSRSTGLIQIMTNKEADLLLKKKARKEKRLLKNKGQRQRRRREKQKLMVIYEMETS